MNFIKLLTKNVSGSTRAVVGISIMALVILVAVFAPVIAPYDPTFSDITLRLQPPSSAHIFGTDNLGRDILSRIMYGAQIALIVGVLSVAFSGTIGVILGLIAGYYKKAGTVIMRIVDIFLSIPYVLFAVVLIAALGPGLKNVIIAMGVTRWVQYARITYGSVLSIKEQEFIEGAVARGNSNTRIILKHIAPNAFSQILVLATLEIAFMIIMESTLSFLGLGVQPPDPSWGWMLADGREYLTVAWWMTTFPGIAITLTVLGMNIFGDWLRDQLDPRLKF